MTTRHLVTNPWRIVIAVVLRPWLWRTAYRFRPNGSLTPIPPYQFARFRLETMYGGRPPWTPPPSDIVRYLRWAKGVRVS